MEDISLLDAVGIASMLGELGRTDPVLSASVDDLMDPTGYYRSSGFDSFGNPLPSGGGSNVGLKGPKPQNPFVRRLSDFKEGFDAVTDPRVAKQTKALEGMLGPKVQGPVPRGPSGMAVKRMAGQALRSGVGQAALKYLPAVGTALSVGDLVLGNESLGNKAMDASLMAAGGFLGSAVPVVGTAIGATGGKMVSDGLQWLFGDKMTPEERQVQQALAALNGGVV